MGRTGRRFGCQRGSYTRTRPPPCPGLRFDKRGTIFPFFLNYSLYPYQRCFEKSMPTLLATNLHDVYHDISAFFILTNYFLSNIESMIRRHHVNIE